MVTATPLLADIVRKDTFILLQGETWPGYGKVCLLNALIIFISLLFAIFYDKVYI